MSARVSVTSPVNYTGTGYRSKPPVSQRRTSHISTATTGYTSRYTPSSSSRYSSTLPSYTPTYTSTYQSTYRASDRVAPRSRLDSIGRSSRPLPSGPGPLNEYGKKISVSEGINRTQRLLSNPTSTHSVSIKTDIPRYRTTTRTPSPGLKRSESISDITHRTGSLNLVGGSSSITHSRTFGSQSELHRPGSGMRSRSLAPSESRYHTSTKTSSYSNEAERKSGAESPHRSSSESSSISNYATLPPIPKDRRKNEEDSNSGQRVKSKAVDSYASTQSSYVPKKMPGQSSLSPSRTSSNKSDLGRVGLKNIGNTCFMNSILQCLSNTKPLLDFCLQEFSDSDINRSTSKTKGTLISAYIKLMKTMWRENADSSVTPSDLKGQLQKHAPRFGGYSQHDSQELLIHLLEGLHEDLNRVRAKVKVKIEDDSGEEKISAAEKSKLTWKRYLERDNSKIVDIFVGQLRSSLTCTQCGYVSNTFDPFWDLSLPLQRRQSISLSQCFDLFTQEEILDGDEKPTCARCKTRQKCTKRFSIMKFPKILIIHLKRFDPGAYSRTKLSTPVDFPVTTLDLSKYAENQGGTQAMYNLYAVSNHSGTPSFGHYTANCKHPYDQQWGHYDDARVSSSTTTPSPSSEAYVLFYELANSHPRL